MTARRTVDIVGRVIVVVAVVLLWQQFTRDATSVYVRPPTEIADALREQVTASDLLSRHVWPSVSRVLRGLALATAVGSATGALLGRVPRLRPWLAPTLHVVRSVPPPALIGVLLVSFGIGDGPKVFLVFLGAVFPVLFNAMDGAASIDGTAIDAARVMGLRRRDVVGRIVLPAVAPRVFAGLRASTAIALVVVVTSEVTGSRDGLGTVISESQQMFRWQDVWAVLVTLAVIGAALNGALVVAERALLRWQRAGERDLRA